MENRFWFWVTLALVAAMLFMPFESENAPTPHLLEQSAKITIKEEIHKDTHKLHFSMSPFWSNSSGGLLSFH